MNGRRWAFVAALACGVLVAGEGPGVPAASDAEIQLRIAELGHDELALRRTMAEAGAYLSKRRLVDTDGQISWRIKCRQRQTCFPLRPSFGAHRRDQRLRR